MPGNTIGKALTLTTWGESHGPCIGGVLDGLPPGIELNLECIQKQLDRRRPGQNENVSPRCEPDQIEILSGLFEGKTLGTPLAFLIPNTNQKSADYDALKHVYRPGHGDFTYQQKYGWRDHRGGGRSSARSTASLVAAGAVCEQVLRSLLPDIRFECALAQLGPLLAHQDDWSFEYSAQNALHCPSPRIHKTWETHLSHLKSQGKSCGGIVFVKASGIPATLGEPVFDKLDADIAHIMMGINAAKGVEIGLGFDVADAPCGFDEMHADDAQHIEFCSNHAGGILAGISTSQPIEVRVAFKPTSSTPHLRKTVDDTGNNLDLSVFGRHDPCVAIRAVPIVQAALTFVLCDHALRQRGQCGRLS